MELTVTTAVRSFDFDDHTLTGDRACFVDGVIVAMDEDSYTIKVVKDVWGGKEVSDRVGQEVVAPINGILNWVTGEPMNQVESLYCI